MKSLISNYKVALVSEIPKVSQIYLNKLDNIK
jgi:hypothetical protein